MHGESVDNVGKVLPYSSFYRGSLCTHYWMQLMEPIDRVKMEFFQYAYVRAVTADAGKSCEIPIKDTGIDIRVSDFIPNPENPNGYDDGGVVFNCQLKASTLCRFEDGDLLFPMKVRDYNRMVGWDGVGIKILVAFNMPKQPAAWLSQNTDVLCLKHCCYWTELTGKERSLKSEDSRIHVRIPETSIFNTKAVMQLARRARQAQYS